MKKYVVGSTKDIPEGSRTLVHVKGRPIAIFNIKGEYFGLFDRCPHLGGSLCRGALTGLIQSKMPGEYSFVREGEIVRCPWHGWEFDIRTGKSYCDPEKIRARNFPVSVEDGRHLMEGPYVAETVPVKVEDDYVVVEL
ncbi:Rieske (2Fe-2S) protein [Ancylobacter mangrovi]|uniref:Rieske (2Fe-2S) protein n=1 Tax=Ancylobacter mangrovi TaxID=2972472 RepID=UPI002162F239|nr:Rieske (2Fe-2S) protein [Ancylobacter mangrovi]MCS0502033.1 Rieske (2Fe-2S) protein [Ancylobacter mangrovi]